LIRKKSIATGTVEFGYNRCKREGDFQPAKGMAGLKESGMMKQMQNQYLALPESGSGAGVLVLHAWWGLNEFMRSFCDRLAREGFVALAPDLFSGKVAQTVEEAEQHLHEFDEEHDVPPKILSAVEELSKLPSVAGKGLGVIGFSLGASWALWLAQKRPEDIRAVAVFYGTQGGGGDYAQSQAAYMGHFAEKDPYEPADGVQELEKSLRAANRPVSFFTYPGTGHWFFESNRPDAYRPQPAQQAWERTVAFLHSSLDEA
jgi:carboxymethylenebutenolidase